MKENYVATNLEQDFTDREKAQARDNIDAAPASAVLPSYTSSDANKSLSVNADGNGVEWDYRMRGSVVQDDGQGGTASSDLRSITVNVNSTAKGLVRVRPVDGSNLIAGLLAPWPETFQDEGKMVVVNSNASALEYANVPTFPQIGFIQHNQEVTIQTGQFVNPERYNLNCYIPARTNFYGSITIDNIYTNDPQAMYNFRLWVPNNDMDCIFGTYPQLPSCGHNINFVVSNTATTQYQVYFALSGTFVSQDIEVKVRGITVSM
jgi:hypothetical protein